MGKLGNFAILNVLSCVSYGISFTTLLVLFCQPAKPRSRSWNESQDNKALQQASIWSKSYVPGLTSAPGAPTPIQEKIPPTKGKERVVSVKGLKLSMKEPQVKRPRQGKFTENGQFKLKSNFHMH